MRRVVLSGFFRGTSASGAGIHGCFEMGCSVVATGYDGHHRTHLSKFLLTRALEAMLCVISNMFRDDIVQARSAELNLAQLQGNSNKDETWEGKQPASYRKKNETTGKNNMDKKNDESKRGKKALEKKHKQADTSSSSDSESVPSHL